MTNRCMHVNACNHTFGTAHVAPIALDEHRGTLSALQHSVNNSLQQEQRYVRDESKSAPVLVMGKFRVMMHSMTQ